MKPTEAMVEKVWQDLIEMDDRTSPEEYPDMALITIEELAQALADQHAATVEACAKVVIAEGARLAKGDNQDKFAAISIYGLVPAIRALAAGEGDANG